MSRIDEARIDRLYDLLRREKDVDTVANTRIALRWAIFTLEQLLK